MTDRAIRKPLLAALLLLAGNLPVGAQDDDEEQYRAQIPDVSIYKAMLDANKQTGWVQFREFAGRQAACEKQKGSQERLSDGKVDQCGAPRSFT